MIAFATLQRRQLFTHCGNANRKRTTQRSCHQAECSKSCFQTSLDDVVLKGGESESSGLGTAPARKRARVALVTWSCPTTFPATFEECQKCGLQLPSDLTRAEFGEAVLAVLKGSDQTGSLKYLIVVREYHRRYVPEGGRFHTILAMGEPFLHKSMSDFLARRSVKAWFRVAFKPFFPELSSVSSSQMAWFLLWLCCSGRNGLAAYRRSLCVAGKKLAGDIDASPWLYPPDVLSWEKIESIMANMPMDQQVTNKLAERRQPKRKTMTFGELSERRTFKQQRRADAKKRHPVEQVWRRKRSSGLMAPISIAP